MKLRTWWGLTPRGGSSPLSDTSTQCPQRHPVFSSVDRAINVWDGSRADPRHCLFTAPS